MTEAVFFFGPDVAFYHFLVGDDLKIYQACSFFLPRRTQDQGPMIGCDIKLSNNNVDNHHLDPDLAWRFENHQ